MYKILVSDPLDATGLGLLRESGHQVDELEDRDRLLEVLPEYDALVVRSGTKVTEEVLAAGTNLKVVGRAGIGVDNVDVAAATQRGILVINAPTANLISATEHTFAMMLSIARNVAVADRSMKEERWDRKKYVGTELQGKTLGVIGFGRIGQQVARRAQAFDMKILAYDPFLDPDHVRKMDVEPSTLDELLPRADFITLHIPKTDETRNLLNAERIGLMKKSAFLVNCARGGVVDEAALLQALENEALAGAAVDVFASEPPEDYALAQHPRVVATPHLGASTREAQVRISTDTAEMVIAALDGSLNVTAVNLPFRGGAAGAEPYLRLADKLGRLAGSQVPGGCNEIRIELCGLEESLHASVTVAAIKGALVRSHGEAINFVNAEHIAEQRGIKVVRSVLSGPVDYPHLVRLHLKGSEGEVEIAGSLFHERDPRIISFDGYHLEFRPEGDLLLVRNRDVPGVVGKLGTALGEAKVNIAAIHLSRKKDSGEALAVVRLDQALPEEVLDGLRAQDEVLRVDSLNVG